MFSITKGKVNKAQRFVFYGSEGIGKSTFASKLPSVLFIDTEGSTNQLDVSRLPAPSSWQMLLKQMNYVKCNPTICKSLVIDTADWAERMCIEHICAKLNIKGIEDMGFGKGYTYVFEEFGKFLDMATDVCNVGVNVGFTAHAILRKFEQPDEMGAYDRYELKLSKKVASMVKEWADLVLFMNYKTLVIADGDKKTKKAYGGKRVIYATHHPCWDAKNRHGLADEMDMDYRLISHVFDPVPTMDTTPKEETTLPPSAPPQTPMPKINYDGFPQSLIDLMKIDHVHPMEVYGVVAQRGYFPATATIASYPNDFVQGVLIGAWSQVLEMIQKNRGNVPF